MIQTTGGDIAVHQYGEGTPQPGAGLAQTHSPGISGLACPVVKIRIDDPIDDTIKEKVEAVIAKYDPLCQQIIDEVKPRLDGKKVMIYVGGPRPRHTIGA